MVVVLATGLTYSLSGWLFLSTGESLCACVTVSIVSGEVAQYVCRHGRTVDGNARRSASFSTNCSSNGMKTLLGSSRLCTDTARIDLSLSVVLVLVCCLPKGGLVDARLCADTAKTTLSHSVFLVLVRSLPGTYHCYYRFFAVGAKRLRGAELLCNLQHRRSCSKVQLGRARCAFRYGRPFVQSGVSRDDHRNIIDDLRQFLINFQRCRVVTHLTSIFAPRISSAGSWIIFVGLFTSSLVSYSEKLSEQPCDGRCCSHAVRAPTLPWRSASCTSSTNEEYPFPQSPSRFVTFKNGVVGTGNTVPRGMLLVERCFSDKPSLVIRHMGMPYASRFLNV